MNYNTHAAKCCKICSILNNRITITHNMLILILLMLKKTVEFVVKRNNNNKKSA